MSDPRVWFDGDTVPAGVWVIEIDEEDPEHRVTQLDAYEPCRNGNLGPLVELAIPDDLDGIVERARAARAEPPA